MGDEFTPMVDLSAERRLAHDCATNWGVELEAPFAMSNVSYVAPTTDGAVMKVAWGGDDEALYEADALELWDGHGAVRLLRRFGRALLEERATPGSDLATLPDAEATRIAVDLAVQLWRPATAPFQPIAESVTRWLHEARNENHELHSLALELFAQVGGGAEWLVHGDFHHHNILRFGDRFVAIDPKPCLADREYDVPSFLWNPINNHLEDHDQTERRIRAFVGVGLDEFRIRAWTIIRGSCLRPGPEYAAGFRALMDSIA